MRPIGFSTGALALSDFRLALEELQGQATDSIELSALRYRELRPLLHALGELTLVASKYKSIHFMTSPAARCAEQLRRRPGSGDRRPLEAICAERLAHHSSSRHDP